MSKKKSSASLSPFEKAFAHARSMGLERFWFKKKIYHTLTKEEVDQIIDEHMKRKFQEQLVASRASSPEPITLEAHKIVYGRGEEEYGHPAKNFQHTADLWNAQFQNILGDSEAHKFTAEDIAYAMILVKLSRQENHPKRDNLVDVAGYAETAQRVIERKVK